MANPPRQKGTAAETAAARWLTDELGMPITRAPLAGNADKGDLLGIDWLCIEIKNTKVPSIAQWGKELAAECRNSGKPHGVVLWSPPGVGLKRVEDWIALEWAFLRVLPRFSRGVPHVGPMNKLHRYVAAMDSWDLVTNMSATGGFPTSTWEVRATCVRKWVETVRERVASDGMLP